VFLTVLLEVGAFREVLPQQAVGGEFDLEMVQHFHTLIPGQRPAQMCRQGLNGCDQRRRDQLGPVAARGLTLM
jgi:hypothetical protein